MDRRHLHAVPRGMSRRVLLLDQPGIVRPIRARVHTGRESKIGKL